MTFLSRLLCAGAVAVAATTAHAGTLQTTYSASSYDTAPGSHSLWASGGLGSAVGGDFNFSPSGVFKKFTDSGSGAVVGGQLSGNVVSSINASAGFTLNFNYDVDFSDFASGPTYKAEGGSPSEPGDNYFLNLAGGTLVGFGDLAGMNLSVTRRPDPSVASYATQVGTGSNAKNMNYGMANWLFFKVDSCTICGTGGIRTAGEIEGRAGDININLDLLPGAPTPVPLPAGGMLLLTGLAGLAAARKGRKKA